MTVTDEGVVESEKSGGGVTVKLRALLATPPTITPTEPVVAPAGTGTTMSASLQLVGTATPKLPK